MLRDRLANSGDAAVRVCGVTIGALLPRLDEHFSARAFLDPSPLVRTAMADALEGVELPDRETALRLIRDQLQIENHRSALSALYFALGSLVRNSGRQSQLGTDRKDTH